MKDYTTIIFIIIVVASILFEKIAQMKKARERNKQPRKSPQSNESAEEFFKRIKQEEKRREVPAPTEIKPQNETPPRELNASTRAATPLTTSNRRKKVKAKKKTLDFKDKTSVRQAIIMKTLLDSPQAYKH